MAKVNLIAVALAVTLLLLAETWAQNPKKRLAPPKPPKAQCCDEVRSLKVQVANLTSILGELSRKQETDLMNVVRQIMELDKQNRQQEARVTEAESKYSEINNRVEIMQLQTLQSATQTSSGEHQCFEVVSPESLLTLDAACTAVCGCNFKTCLTYHLLVLNYIEMKTIYIANNPYKTHLL